MRKLVGALALTGLVVGAGWGVVAADDPKPAPERARGFAEEVREDIFAGFKGDDEALQQGIAACEEALAKDPKNAEAMVWRGAARVYSAGRKFATGKPAEAFPLWGSGLKDLDEAVAIAPDKVGVRIPRAATLLPAARNSPPGMAKPLLTKALADFQFIYDKQKDHLDKLPTHSRGELRMGLADIYRLMGQPDKSKEQLEAIARELPDTRYAARAREWLAAKPEAKLVHNCLGCHTPGQ